MQRRMPDLSFLALNVGMPGGSKRARHGESQDRTLEDTLALLALQNALDVIDPKTARRACLERFRDEVLFNMETYGEPYTMTLHVDGSELLTIPLKVSDHSQNSIKFTLARQLPEGSIPIPKYADVTFNFMTIVLEVDEIEGYYDRDLLEGAEEEAEEESEEESYPNPHKILRLDTPAPSDKWSVSAFIAVDMREHVDEVVKIMREMDEEDQYTGLFRAEYLLEVPGQIMEVEIEVERR